MPSGSPKTTRALVVGENSASLSHAVLLTHHGVETVLLEDDESGVVRSLDFLKRLYDGQPDWQADIIKPVPVPFEKLTGRFDILIDAGEAKVEDRIQKLSSLSKHLNPNSLIAFQTSMPDPLSVKKRGGSVSAIHQFYISGPPHLATLVEWAKFENTDNDTFTQFWQMLGKQVIITKTAGQFVANRLSSKFYKTLDTNKTLVISDRLVQEGRLGKKVGVGWYRYPGGGGAVIDPLLEDLIVEEAYFAKVVRRTFTEQEIVSLVVAALTEEAELILKMNSVQSACDLDKLSIQALHFPHGGICSYADQHSS